MVYSADSMVRAIARLWSRSANCLHLGSIGLRHYGASGGASGKVLSLTIVGLTDDAGNVLASMEFAAVNRNDCVLLPNSIKRFKQVIKTVGLNINGVELNLDSGFDSRANRKIIWNANLRQTLQRIPVTEIG